MRVACVSAVLLLGFSAWGCAGRPEPLTDLKGPGLGCPVLGHFAGRRQTVTIKSGPAGLLYCVLSKDGRALSCDLSEAELRAAFPAVHDWMTGGVAGSDGIIDASVGLDADHPGPACADPPGR